MVGLAATGLLETSYLAKISVVVCFIISYCRYMFRSLFGHPQAEYTILVIGNYYTHNGPLFCILFSLHVLNVARFMVCFYGKILPL
jgi:hypothetical protein